MASAKGLTGPLCVLALTCGCVSPLHAEEDQQRDKFPARSAPSSPATAPNPSQPVQSQPGRAWPGATAGAPARPAPAGPAPRTPGDDDDREGSGTGPYRAVSLYPSTGAGAGDGGGSPAGGAPFGSLPVWLQAHAVAWYGGAGLDYVVVQYPASTDTNVAWQFFGGLRGRYAGAELDYHTMGYYHATINNQGVEVGTDMASLSVLGYLPLSDDSDLYLRYGRTAWSVNATGASGTASLMTSGINGTAGIGLEFRHGRLLMRTEARKFWRIYQSDDHVSFGISVGAYFD